MNRERRKTYRVALRPCNHLLISVFPEQGLPLLGDVVELSIQGARATFSAKPPPLPLAELVRISLATRGSPHPVETEARVVSRSDERRVRSYELEFTNPAMLERGLNARLFTLFNRRGQVRVPLVDTPRAVRAEGVPSPRTHRVEVHDLSVGGLALRVAPEVARELRGATDLQVRFRVPGKDHAVQVVGRIRVRRTTAQGFIFGVEMDPRRTRNFPQLQDLIVEYIHGRQVELCEQDQPQTGEVA